ncbi:hypothetical protein [Cytobacillus oceanisediminis]|uniref:hypothetical protein n=1 Tax=Cytobacillus oceanisediminis TaxID=665099 RepID=UPI00203F7A8A|nr:hypothetical protein [Cytobacillus oceanisediminis]MCM3403191.1 hypothetical protein [Cytobacillus oceanisediminis]MDK7666256.1 hypothetical protein [Cytobacillus oceanisediminis]
MAQETRGKSVYLDIDRRIFETKIKPLITKELIKEHKLNPIGKHSEQLDVVLNYLRRHQEQLVGKLVIVCTDPHKEWHIGEHPAVRGERPKIFWEESFDSRETAEHGLFLKRLQKLGVLK